MGKIETWGLINERGKEWPRRVLLDCMAKWILVIEGME